MIMTKSECLTDWAAFRFVTAMLPRGCPVEHSDYWLCCISPNFLITHHITHQMINRPLTFFIPLMVQLQCFLSCVWPCMYLWYTYVFYTCIISHGICYWRKQDWNLNAHRLFLVFFYTYIADETFLSSFYPFAFENANW